VSDTPYLVPDDIRAKAWVSKLTLSESDLAAYIAEFEAVCEDYRGVAFTTRTVASETVFIAGTYYAFGDAYSSGYYGTGRITRQSIILQHCKVQELTSMTINGITQDVNSVTLDSPTGMVYNPLGFAPESTIVVAYTHGFPTPPPQCLRACQQYVRAVALSDNSNVSRDVISTAVDGRSERYSTADKSAGRPTGYLEVDRLLNSLPDFRTVGVG